MSMNVGLFFGSFNPIHIGHLITAQAYLNYSSCDQIWLMVSPQNPFKNKSTLLNEVERYRLCEIASENHDKIFPSNFEFTLPKPSYTILTLSELSAFFPKYKFSIMMGSDNLLTLHKWKNYKAIIDHYPIYVYPRHNSPIDEMALPSDKIFLIDAPLIEISSSYIRNLLQQKKSIDFLTPDPVKEYILSKGLYQNY